MREVGIGIAGFGTVGGGVLSILRSHAGDIEARLGARIAVRRVAVRDEAKERARRPRRVAPHRRGSRTCSRTRRSRWSSSSSAAWTKPSSSCGARSSAASTSSPRTRRSSPRAATEIFRLAREKGVDVYYEAAVCGGVPIIRTLREALASDRINALHGIVNGTTNFILTAMDEQGAPFEDALREAQRLGYAEADPDPRRLAAATPRRSSACSPSSRFGARLAPQDVLTEGITAAPARGLPLGPRVRLRAEAARGRPPRRTGRGRRPGAPDQIEARVHPAFIPAGSLLAGVRGAMNAVVLHSEALGPSMLLRPGRGRDADGERGRLGHHRPDPQHPRREPRPRPAPAGPAARGAAAARRGPLRATTCTSR